MQWAEIEIPGMILPLPPSISPTFSPSSNPTQSPSLSPTTATPTAALPTTGLLVNNILTKGSPVTNFGCNSLDKPWNTFDGTTTQYACDRRGMNNVTDEATFQIPGIIVTPEHGQLTIPKEFRMYPASSCVGCDPLTYILEGRLDSTSPWISIASGDLPGVSERNVEGIEINSAYESGDSSLSFTSVAYPSNSAAYLDYRISFPQTRASTANWMRWAEIEIAGVMLPSEPSGSPTSSPSSSPVKLPTTSPSTSPTTNPTIQLPDGLLVNNILTKGSPVTNFGCNSLGMPWKTFE